ncbi:hypothetical protein ACV344_32020 [Pseudomonas aeruginosa]|uniref:hypothetical protein n=1 Tax=Pseudomonas aeruginosa TaxID=287 RepID=UPI00209BC1B5|nr:hypothetical protein [Pseudomonas aeruginosa]MCV6103493.1 hypothetical protein [Pseudomonas aeruginosa]MDI2198512.1 hypothetical protein [Pseudomonas aeruginosa]MDP5663434.1 hypothetical protein [Pseudomonas aeruginosa]MDP5831437.1 hypothetical protein [Pseudomonas aeruginosa]MDY1163390.1 hypothetical protein [Pseudomonas aeruginosa]
MSNELTDVRCSCGDEYPADSYDAGFIAGSGMCQNCDAALPPKDICTCPSGNGSLRHPCPAHPAVEQAGGDARKLSDLGNELHNLSCSIIHENEEWAEQIGGIARELWNWPQARAALAHDEQEQAAHELRLLANALGECIQAAGITAPGVPLTGPQLLMFAEDLKRDLQRSSLAQPSPKCATCNGSKVVSTMDTDHNGDYIEAPCPKCCGTGEADSGGTHPWGEPVLISCDCETEQAEPELEPHIPAQNIAEAAIEQLIKSGAKHYQEFHFDLHLDGQEGARPVVVTVAFSDGPSAHELRMKAEQERDAALAEVERLRESKGDPVGSLEKCMKVMYERDENAKRLEVALARVAELEGKLTDWVHEGFRLNEALAVAQAQHSVPEISGIGRDAEHPRAVVLYLRNEPSDEDMRAIQNFLRAMPADVSAKAQHSVPEGWKLVPIEPLFNMMSDKDHDTRITAERQLLSILADAPGNLVPQAWLDVQAERRRQNTAEGWTPEHDDLYCAAELPRAAAAYILNGANDEAPAIWPFSAKWWKPRDARSNYVRAGALILAEIERLDRARQGGRS